MERLGIDIGGSGIKAAIVDTQRGELRSERLRYPTPEDSTPRAVLKLIAQLRDDFGWQGPVGCGFPGVVRAGQVLTAANLHKEWIGVDLREQLAKLFGSPAHCLNDADAAGLAEVAYGAGKGEPGVTLMVTIGTGLGSALFRDGVLMPNLELGHLLVVPPGEKRPIEAEQWASGAVRKREDLKWPEWGERFNYVLCRYRDYLWPSLIIIGGGASKKFEKFAPCLDVGVPIRPALMNNNAGIVGAAAFAAGEGAAH